MDPLAVYRTLLAGGPQVRAVPPGRSRPGWWVRGQDGSGSIRTEGVLTMVTQRPSCLAQTCGQTHR